MVTDLPITDPIAKYMALRENEWQSTIPMEFLNFVLENYCVERAKGQNLTPKGLGAFVAQRYQEILDFCSNLPCDPNFYKKIEMPIEKITAILFPNQEKTWLLIYCLKCMDIILDR